MTEETGEQDLVKALDSVAGTGSSFGGPLPDTDSSQPQAGAVASPFPPIQPLPAPLPSTPTDTPPTFTIPDPISSTPSTDAYGSTPLAPTPATTPDPATPAEDTGPLASIKQDALVELRPLVDKLTLSPEEKFDTLLLLIRSTDDTELIAPAHEAAKQIVDETRRAEALLDIIKEIDYLSHPKTDV